MPSPTLKLTYFDIKGRAESCRLALVLGGVPFEDDRIKHDTWKTMKASTPFGQVPVLTVDGTMVAQSLGILRYCGVLGKLYPTEPLKALLVDQVVFTIDDIFATLAPTWTAPQEKKVQMREELIKTSWPTLFEGLEKVVKQHGGNYCVGDSLTVADIVVYTAITSLKSGNLDGIPKTFIDSYKTLTAIYEKVHGLEKVTEWNAKHNK